MKYWLRILVLGHSENLEITESAFRNIVSSRQNLSLFSSFTENYRVTLDSYRRVEINQYELALDHVLFGYSPYKGFLDAKVTLSSAVMGYLTAARYFHDWADKNLKIMIGDQSFQDFDKSRSDFYDSNPEYQFIEALRNYVQHRSLPIEAIKYHNFVEDRKNHENSDIATASSLYSDREKLREDKKFKKTVLSGMPEKINIIQCVRCHMSGIWKIHDLVISRNGKRADEARKVIETHRDRFSAEVGGNLIGLHAVSEKDGTIVDQLPLLLDWDDARRDALKQTGNLTNLSRRYVTGKIQRT